MFLKKRIFIISIFFLINDKKFCSSDKYALKPTAKKISNNLTYNSLCCTRITEFYGIDSYRNYSIIL